MDVSGHIRTGNLELFPDLLSRTVGYAFDDLDRGAIEAGLPGTDADDGSTWFEYPLVGRDRLDAALADERGSGVTAYRIDGVPDETFAARIPGWLDILYSCRVTC